MIVEKILVASRRRQAVRDKVNALGANGMLRIKKISESKILKRLYAENAEILKTFGTKLDFFTSHKQGPLKKFVCSSLCTSGSDGLPTEEYSKEGTGGCRYPYFDRTIFVFLF